MGCVHSTPKAEAPPLLSPPPSSSPEAEDVSLLSVSLRHLDVLRLQKLASSREPVVLGLHLTLGTRGFSTTVTVPRSDGDASLHVPLPNVFFRSWLRRGEESFLLGVALFREPADELIARGFIPLTALADGKRHTFRVSLSAPTSAAGKGASGELGLTDADLHLVEAASASISSPKVGSASSRRIDEHADADQLGDKVEEGADIDGAVDENAVAVLSLSAYVLERADAQRRFIRRLVQEVDSNSDKTLDSAELEHFLALIDADLSEEEERAFFESIEDIDDDEDGLVNIERVLDWFDSPMFKASPMSASLMKFISERPPSWVSAMVEFAIADRAASSTRDGAGRVAIKVGRRVVVDELGLNCIDRTTGLLVTEKMQPHIKLAVKLMYHSGFGRRAVSTNAVRRQLQLLSKKEGEHMDSTASAREIPKFIATFALNMDDVLPGQDFSTFNKFFCRKLRPEARPIASPDDDAIVVSPADCRLIVFPTVSEAASLWVKGESFTIERLFGSEHSNASKYFMDGAVAICRLAPQDYHLFHAPVTATSGRWSPIAGALYTVNPMAIRSPRPDVYIENKRVVSLHHTELFGTVAFIPVGATCVGSINLESSVVEGAALKKGDLLGGFAFGGSTVIVCFQKGAVVFDKDLLESSQKCLETIVRFGMSIGTATRAAGLAQVTP